MVKSSYSGREIPLGKGIMYVKKDGKILWFLNRKEEKNMFKLGRKPRTQPWTEEHRKNKNQRIAMAQHAAELAHEQDNTPVKPAKKEQAEPKPVSKSPVAKKAPAKKTTKEAKK